MFALTLLVAQSTLVLSSLVRMGGPREIQGRNRLGRREINGKITDETRFHITSLAMLAPAVGPMIRAHWAIENSLHWVMDMAFRDDECRIRTDNAPANFVTCRHIAYNLTRKAPGKDSIRLRRKTAAWGDEYLASLIAA